MESNIAGTTLRAEAGRVTRGTALRLGMLAATVWVVLAAGSAGAATFQGLDNLPSGAVSNPMAISGDGLVVVGQSCGAVCRAFRWTAATGVVDLGTLPGDTSAIALAVNRDGSVVTGQSCDAAITCRAFRWTAATGMASLGRLAGDNTAEGIGVSADGSVVVGPSCAAVCHAFRWTAATGMVDIGILPGDSTAFPLAVSGDGAVVVGSSGVTGTSSHAFRWTAASGMVNLGTLPGDILAQATGVNGDGSVIVGFSSGFNMPSHAFRWTAATGLVNIGTAPGDTQARPSAVNADGSVVVGLTIGAATHGARWTAATGMQTVQSLLTQLGVDLTGWTLNSAKSVSADGNVIVGIGQSPHGSSQGYIASLADSGPCAPLPALTVLAAAVLPASRSVSVGTAATVFATIINAGPTVACSVGIALATNSVPATLTYNTTDCTTNMVTGATNSPVNIAVGAQACFVLAITPTAPFSPIDLAFSFAGDNTVPVAPITGVNTLLMSASATPVPDIVALAATATGDGIVNIPGTTGTGAFVVATVNLGLGAPITAAPDTGSTVLPVTLNICQTDATGNCSSPIGPTVSTFINTNETPTFAIFVTGNAFVAFDPAHNRVFVRFTDAGGVTRGATSVAVRTQ